jgi:hypothetical protein
MLLQINKCLLKIEMFVSAQEFESLVKTASSEMQGVAGHFIICTTIPDTQI